MNDPLRLAVVGAGIMGTNHARVARQLRGAELIAVVDSDLERAKAAASAAEARAVTDIEEIIGDIDAAIIAVEACCINGVKKLVFTSSSRSRWRRASSRPAGSLSLPNERASCLPWGTSNASTPLSPNSRVYSTVRSTSRRRGSAPTPLESPTV